MTSPGARPPPQTLLSPASSHASSAIAHASSLTPSLPRPRSSPLKPGGSKESSLIRYVDAGVLRAQRRFAKREVEGRLVGGENRPGALPSDDEAGKVEGYRHFGDAAGDVGALVDVVWISGTPSIQIPYLLSLALLTTTFISGLPLSPRPMFALLAKLDLAFASLLLGRHDAENGDEMPGSASRSLVSDTEKVRVRGVVESARICVVEAFARDNAGAGGESEAGTGRDETSDDSDEFGFGRGRDKGMVSEDDGDEDEDGHGQWHMHIAKVYERTIEAIG